MEISRHLKPGYTAQADAAPTRVEGPEKTKADSAAPRTPAQSTEPRLEQLQEAIRSLPDVDMDKITMIKQALQRGDVALDTAALANLILTYHRGSEV